MENEIPNVSGFLLTSVFNSKITEIENKIPDIKNLVNKTELKTVEDKIPDFNGFVKKLIMVQKSLKLKITMLLQQH